VAISIELILNASQQDELIAISQSRSLAAGYVFRAKLILMLPEGASLVEREVIARGIFTSVKDLARKLCRYINA
jgi:hypothetical protein